MTTLFGWIPLVLALVLVGVFFGGLASWAALRVAGSALTRVAPRTRFAILWLLSALPALGAVSVVGISFAPSVLDALGLVADHCSHHLGHAFHLCFVHGSPPETSWPIVAVAVAILGSAALGWVRELRALGRARQWANRLEAVSRYDESLGGWMMSTADRVAFTVGLFSPAVFVSEGLRDTLSPSQFEAVLAHEREHARRRDGLTKRIARLAACLHAPSLRDELLCELDVASEQACDEAAARAIGDRLTVAEAIVSVARLGRRDVPCGAVGFGTGAIEQRVRGMLEGEWAHPGRAVAALGGVLVVALVVGYESLHHATETLLSHLF